MSFSLNHPFEDVLKIWFWYNVVSLAQDILNCDYSKLKREEQRQLSELEFWWVSVPSWLGGNAKPQVMWVMDAGSDTDVYPVSHCVQRKQLILFPIRYMQVKHVLSWPLEGLRNIFVHYQLHWTVCSSWKQWRQTHRYKTYSFKKPFLSHLDSSLDWMPLASQTNSPAPNWCHWLSQCCCVTLVGMCILL